MTRGLSPDRPAGRGMQLGEEARRVARGYLPGGWSVHEAADADHKPGAESDRQRQGRRYGQPVECNEVHATGTAVGAKGCRQPTLRRIAANGGGPVGVAGWVQNLTGTRVRTVGSVSFHKPLEKRCLRNNSGRCR